MRQTQYLGIWLALSSLVGCSIYTRQPDSLELYTSDDNQQRKLHFFIPNSAAPKMGYPTIIFFHGGAWQSGDPNQFFAQCSELSEDGLQCISAEYRVKIRDRSSPQDALNDARSAVLHLIQNAKALNINPNKLILAGGSSGAHLASMVAIGQAQAEPVPASALVLFNPMLDLSPGKPDHELAGKDWQNISPLHQLKGPLPHTLILLGTKDREVPVPLAKEFCNKAESFGNKCQLALSEGQGHGFFNPHVSRIHFYLTLRRIRQFLNNLDLI